MTKEISTTSEIIAELFHKSLYKMCRRRGCMQKDLLTVCEHRVYDLRKILADTRPQLPTALQALCMNRLASVNMDNNIHLCDIAEAGLLQERK